MISWMLGEALRGSIMKVWMWVIEWFCLYDKINDRLPSILIKLCIANFRTLSEDCKEANVNYFHWALEQTYNT